MSFTPKFVDLVRNVTSVTGTGPVTLGAAVNGYTSLAAAVSAGEQFYYCIQSIDKPAEREVGRGTMQADGKVARQVIAGSPTNFSSGAKTIALVAAAEWFGKLDQLGGGMNAAASRSELAGKDGAAASRVFLAEGGRAGSFVFDASNLSASVAADPAQGLFIAPASDPTGAAGAWVRKFDGEINVKWFGAVGDGVTNDSAAFLAAIACLNSIATTGYGFGKGAPILFIPKGHYFLGTTTLELTHTITLRGESCGGPSGAATILRWAAGTTGIRTQSYNTSGATGGAVSTSYPGAAMATICNLSLIGGFTTSESESHGIQLRVKTIIEDVYIDSFAGDGIYAKAAVGSPSYEGNANGCVIRNVFIRGCRNGLYLSSPDTNACLIMQLNCNSNRRYGIYTENNIGSTYVGGDMSTNGLTPGFATNVSYSGKWYYCLPGQESWASVNPPSGTTADNQGWGYRQAGGVAPEFPAWSSGMTIRSGGSIRVDGGSNYNSFFGMYAEGDQSPAQMQGHNVVVSPMLGTIRNYDGSVYGGQIQGDTAAWMFLRDLQVDGNFTAKGNTFLGTSLSTDPPTNQNLYLDTNNAFCTVHFRRLGTLIGQIQAYDGNSSIYYFATLGSGAHRFYVGGNPVVAVGSGGLELEAGKSIKVGGVKVLDAQGAALPANATDLATAIALVNAIRARMVAHGLVAA